ncbi:MAG: ABC transporter ATP-binding protein [Holophagaceae bacterium]
MIELRGLTKTYPSPEGGALTVLEDVTLSIPKGASAAILGPSGSGKSTLLGLMAGLDRPSSGTVRVADQDLGALSEVALAAFRARTVGFVFQSFHLLAHFDAFQNVLIAAELAGLQDPAAKAEEALGRVGLGERRHHVPAQLSGGECQRVALARAVVARPPILLCDEPTGSLDAKNADRVFGLLKELHQDLHATLVLVTHDAHLGAQMGLTFALERGRLVDAAHG